MIKLSKTKRCVISELLSIANMANDGPARTICLQRIRKLISGSEPWEMSDQDINAAFQAADELDHANAPHFQALIDDVERRHHEKNC